MIYRHGDLLITPTKINKKAKQVKHNGAFVLAEGETTGHRHVITAERPVDMKVSTLMDVIYLTLSAPAKVTHEEHKTLTVPAGDYKVIHEQEKDWFSLQTRRVID